MRTRVVISVVQITLGLGLSAAALAAPKPAAAPKLEPDDLPGPQLEVAPDTAKVDLPATPSFELPAMDPGFHSVRELRVRGKALIGTDIKVKGYVTAVYDCVALLSGANPNTPVDQIKAAIAKNPALCAPPKFYVGDTRTTPQDVSMWVVDAVKAPVKIGDYVAVSGSWATQSQHNEHNTAGLLIYKTVEKASPPAAAAAPAAAADQDVEVVTKPPMRAKVTDQIRNASIGHTNKCIEAQSASQWDTAISECQAATKAWSNNHLAWYTLASVYMAKNQWTDAVTAIAQAVTQRPDLGMYQLYSGISLYEAAHQPGGDTSKIDESRLALLRAAKLSPALWRAHYYLGKLYRDLDDTKHAAEQFSQTIATYPSYRFGYIALAELYRKWDYNDQALAVATLGTSHVSQADAGDLWFEVGMVDDAKHATDQAIDAFGKALAAKPDDPTPKFQRGQLYYRKGDYANAKRDLEEIAASTDPRMANAKPVAQQYLAQIAKQQAAKPDAPKK